MRTIRHKIEAAKVRLWCATEGDWYLLIAVVSVAVVFTILLTGNVNISY